MATDTEKVVPGPLVLSPEEFSRDMGISLRQTYALIARGEIRSYKDGKRRKIPATERQRRMQQKLAEAA